MPTDEDEDQIMARTGKPPAFQWYGRDFLVAMHGCTLEEIGAAAKLRSVQWEHGPQGSSPAELARALGCTPAKATKLLPALGRIFTEIPGKKLSDLELETQREDMAKYRQIQSEKGIASAASKSLKTAEIGSTAVESRLNLRLQPEKQPQVQPGAQPQVNSAYCDLRTAKEQEQKQESVGLAIAAPPASQPEKPQRPIRSVTSLPAHRRQQTATDALTVLSALNAARSRVLPGARGLRPIAENTKLIEARLLSGNSVEDCLHVIAVREAEVAKNPSAAQWFNAVTPFRPENFGMSLGKEIDMVDAPAPVRSQGMHRGGDEPTGDAYDESPVLKAKREAKRIAEQALRLTGGSK